jgi:hypothetical protein
MYGIILLLKDGTTEEKEVKTLDEDTIYRKAGFRTRDNFLLRHTWIIENFHYKCYAKHDGKHGHENKYVLPQPLHGELYFGNMIIIKWCNDTMTYGQLSRTEWDMIFHKINKHELITTEQKSIVRDAHTYSHPVHTTQPKKIKEEVEEEADDEEEVDDEEEAEEEEVEEEEEEAAEEEEEEAPPRRRKKKIIVEEVYNVEDYSELKEEEYLTE